MFLNSSLALAACITANVHTGCNTIHTRALPYCIHAHLAQLNTHIPYFLAHNTHSDFLLEILEKEK
jgi:hypothetical protein